MYGHSTYKRVLRVGVAKRLLYLPNPYYAFEVIPEFFLPSGIFLDFGGLDQKLEEIAPRSFGGVLGTKIPDPYVYLRKPFFKIRNPKVVNKSEFGSIGRFIRSELNYIHLRKEFLSDFFVNRYNYHYSDVVNLNLGNGNVAGVGIRGFEYCGYNRLTSRFVYNYWGAKQHFSFRFLSSRKAQYFKKLKLDFFDKPPQFLPKLHRKAKAARNSIFQYRNSLSRRRVNYK